MGGRACNDEFHIQPAGRMIAFPLILPAAPFAIGEVERLAAKLAATNSLRSCSSRADYGTRGVSIGAKISRGDHRKKSDE
jgi:hypothetical protein